MQKIFWHTEAVVLKENEAIGLLLESTTLKGWKISELIIEFDPYFSDVFGISSDFTTIKIGSF